MSLIMLLLAVSRASVLRGWLVMPLASVPQVAIDCTPVILLKTSQITALD
jgi:hypothetical protein